MLGPVGAQPGGDKRTPIATLREVACVTQALVHQGVEDGADLLAVLARLAFGERQRVAGQRGHDEAEVALQQRDQLHELEHRAGPAVRQQQRLGVGPAAGQVQEVQLDAVDRGFELRPGVELGLDRTPVEAVAPMRGQFAHEVERGAVEPGRVRRLVGQAVVLVDRGAHTLECQRHAVAGINLDGDLAALVGDHHMVFVEAGRVLRDRRQQGG